MPFKSKEAKRAYQRKWYAERRANWLLLNGPCVVCFSWDGLEIDHIDPSSKVSHKVFSWAEARRNEELAKCQILCRGCHLEKTYRDWYARETKEDKVPF